MCVGNAGNQVMLVTNDALHLYSYPALEPLAVYVMPTELSLQNIHSLPNSQWLLAYECQLAVLALADDELNVVGGSVLSLNMDPMEPREHKTQRYASTVFGPQVILGLYPENRIVLARFETGRWTHLSVWQTESGTLSISAWYSPSSAEPSRIIAISGKKY